MRVRLTPGSSLLVWRGWCWGCGWSGRLKSGGGAGCCHNAGWVCDLLSYCCCLSHTEHGTSAPLTHWGEEEKAHRTHLFINYVIINWLHSQIIKVRLSICVCMCVCVCREGRERQRQREIDREMEIEIEIEGERESYMLQGTPPTVMVRSEGLPVSRFRPVIVRDVPPALGPLSGVTPITNGSWQWGR